ncbi:BTAD domain-containing putative transcriptional regulator [Ilumatobacter sp.]|uniref:BTAD domain-containing putative transcriptional regulator n=1 Tax=Ilumatobacter sp. TaxID=1967498 RepID=UPI003C54534A
MPATADEPGCGFHDLPTRIGVLGPMSVWVGGREVTVSARRQRAVLAFLAVSNGAAVSADRILDAIWGDELPSTGARAVAFHISRLRALLDVDRERDASFIETSAGGYRLRISPSSIDCHRFHEAVDTARHELTEDPEGCERHLTDALALWRGRPFADLAEEPFVGSEVRVLERAHSVALRTAIEARIALGRHRDVIADLSGMVEAEPFDEGLVRLLMIALQRDHRPADGLRVYGELRIRLGDELGIEPSPDLEQLQRELLGAIPVTEVQQGAARPVEIPSAMSSFVGRLDEIERLAELIDSRRVVTLCGFGGLGKTRLAQETARAVADRFVGGVWFVDLTLASTPADLADTVLAAAGFTASDQRDPVADLLESLADHRLLLVLDNCEHLTAGVAELVTQMCRVASGVRILATSREPLGIDGEVIWSMHPLPDREAIQLLRDRARQAAPSMVLPDLTDPGVARLCARLDGIPLAIELAASRLSVMTVSQITDHLEEHLEAVSGLATDRRQDSLRAVISWSWNLLTEADQCLLADLSIFTTDFDLDAAQAIAVRVDGITPLVNGLSRLAERALVVVDDNGGARRFRVLEAVRGVSHGCVGADEVDAGRLRHAEYYASVASTIFDLWVRDPVAMTDLGDLEVGNLRAAMAWAYAHDRVDLGLAITRGARMYFWSRRMHRENIRWMLAGVELALSRTSDGPEIPASGIDDDVLDAAAIVLIEAHNVGDRSALETVLPLVEYGAHHVQEPLLRGNLLSALGARLQATDPISADRLHADAFALRRSSGARALPSLANRIEGSWLSGVLDGADVLSCLREITAQLDVIPPLVTKIEAGVAARRGDWTEVVRVARAMPSADAATEVSVQLLVTEALIGLGDFDEASRVLGALELEARGSTRIIADLLWSELDIGRGAYSTGIDRLTDVVEMLGVDDGFSAVAFQVAALLAVGACGLGDAESSVVLSGFVGSEQARLGVHLRHGVQQLADEATDACRSAMSNERFDWLRAVGAAAEWSELPLRAVERIGA